MRLVDLAGWPPSHGGAYRGNSPNSPQEAMIEEVVSVIENGIVFKNVVTFICTFNGLPISYAFPAPNMPTAERIASILQNSVGKSLFDVGKEQL